MAPINLPDGTEVSEVILPDGASASEVVAPDGSTVFSAIPDSGALHQWNFTEGTGTTVADDNGSLDLEFSSISSWGVGTGAGDTFAVLDGANDHVGLSDDTWDFFMDPAEGTLFFWCRPDFSNARRQLVATDRDNSGNELYLRVGTGDNDGLRLVHTVDGDYTTINGGSVDPYVGEWIVVAAVCNDGGTDKLYLAGPSDYDVTEVASGSGPGSSSGTWDSPISMYRRTAGDTEYFEGGVDLAFVDNSVLSQSDIQQFVDNSKGLYE